MKYSKMLCWLQKSDEERLNQYDLTNAPITFVHSINEFSSLISKEVFCIFSLQFAEDNIIEIMNLVKQFPDTTFNLFAIYNGDLTLNGYTISCENNVNERVFLVEELIDVLSQISKTLIK